MYNYGYTVYAVSVDIHNEDDWNTFINLEQWFEDDAPMDKIRSIVLSNPGWAHIFNVYDVDGFQKSIQWTHLRDSGLAVCIKKCILLNEGVIRPDRTCITNIRRLWGLRPLLFFASKTQL